VLRPDPLGELTAILQTWLDLAIRVWTREGEKTGMEVQGREGETRREMVKVGEGRVEGMRGGEREGNPGP